MTDHPLIEKVAREIHNTMFEERFDDELPNGIGRAIAMNQARAAIAATLNGIKEPSDRMVDRASWQDDGPKGNASGQTHWRVMLEEARKEILG